MRTCRNFSANINFLHVREESLTNKKLNIMLEVKDYSKQELADAIYAGNIKPESRLKKLWREINGCSELVDELHRLHHHTGDTGYTAEMVEKIKYYLCID